MIPLCSSLSAEPEKCSEHCSVCFPLIILNYVLINRESTPFPLDFNNRVNIKSTSQHPKRNTPNWETYKEEWSLCNHFPLMYNLLSPICVLSICWVGEGGYEICLWPFTQRANYHMKRTQRAVGGKGFWLWHLTSWRDLKA